MTFDEAVTPLELERSVFDADETQILSSAFERAWAYVQFDPMLGVFVGAAIRVGAMPYGAAQAWR